MTPDEYVHFANRFPSLQQLASVDLASLTVGTCLEACTAKGYAKGGVGNKSCCACFTCLFDEHSFLL